MPWKDWSNQHLGVALAVLAALGFSFKAIFFSCSAARALSLASCCCRPAFFSYSSS